MKKLAITAVIGLGVALGVMNAESAQASTFTLINAPSATNRTYPSGINDSGQIVGDYLNSSNNDYWGFLDTNGTSVTIIPFANNIYPSGINNSGQIVGYYTDSNGLENGFLYTNQSPFYPYTFNITNISDPSGTKGTYPSGINNSGQIVGYYTDSNGLENGFLDTNGTFTTIDDPSGTNGTEVEGINDSGEIVGYYTDSNFLPHGFLDENGTFTTINYPSSTGDKGYTTIAGINNSGQILGKYSSLSNGEDHVFLDKNGTFTTVNSLSGDNVTGINDSGQIVGDFFSFDVSYTYGTPIVTATILNGFLYTPDNTQVSVPEPSVVNIILPTTLIGLLALRSKKKFSDFKKA